MFSEKTKYIFVDYQEFQEMISNGAELVSNRNLEIKHPRLENTIYYTMIIDKTDADLKKQKEKSQESHMNYIVKDVSFSKFFIRLTGRYVVEYYKDEIEAFLEAHPKIDIVLSRINLLEDRIELSIIEKEF